MIFINESNRLSFISKTKCGKVHVFLLKFKYFLATRQWIVPFKYYAKCPFRYIPALHRFDFQYLFKCIDKLCSTSCIYHFHSEPMAACAIACGCLPLPSQASIWCGCSFDFIANNTFIFPRDFSDLCIKLRDVFYMPFSICVSFLTSLLRIGCSLCAQTVKLKQSKAIRNIELYVYTCMQMYQHISGMQHPAQTHTIAIAFCIRWNMTTFK